MTTATLLAELERAGVRVRRDGNDLVVSTAEGVDLAPWLPVLKAWKPALLAALDWHAEVTRREGFDRARADTLYARLVALEVAAALDGQDASSGLTLAA